MTIIAMTIAKLISNKIRNRLDRTTVNATPKILA
jgi:hypothetical protein